MGTNTTSGRLLPDFVIIGAQKAASTLMSECLRQHPQAYMPRGENHYFRDPFYHRESLDDLAGLFASSGGYARRGIKCPDYLASPECRQRIRNDLCDPQLLVVLRNPVLRTVSAYHWWLKWGGLPLVPAEEGLSRLLDGFYAKDHPHSKKILEYGLYGEHLAGWLEHFSRDNLLIMLDDDLRADAEHALAGVFTFLDIDPAFKPKALQRVQNAGIYSLARLRFLNRRNRFVVFPESDNTELRLARPTSAGQSAYNAAIVLTDRLVLSRLYRNASPMLSASLRERLVDYFSADVERLERLLGRDLSMWSS